MATPDSQRDAVPLCVDLDGTLIHGDLLHEAMLRAVKRGPRHALPAMSALARGRVALKQALAAAGGLDATELPYRQDLLAYLRAEKAAGRRLYLVTASPRIWAEAVAAHLQIFDGVHATEAANLKGAAKAELLVRLHPEGFDYIGDSRADLPVWQAARQVLRAGRGTRIAPPPGRTPALDFPDRGHTATALLRACRPHQWLKNLLIFVPLLAAHAVRDGDALLAAALTFIGFSLTASATYLINDLLDIDADRLHPRKRRRPFAAAVLSVPAGLAAACLLGIAGVATCLAVGGATTAVLLAYVATTLLYSFWLKRVVLVDVFCLAGLYAMRVVAGAVATGVPLSLWLIAFSIFLFLALALVKRCAEMAVRGRDDPGTQLAGRGYLLGDLPLLQMLSASSSFAAVVVFSLYAAQPEVSRLYRSPELLWAVAPLLLFWLCRVLLLTHRGRMHDDPLVFTAKDPKSLALIALAGLVLVVAGVSDLQLNAIVRDAAELPAPSQDAE